MIFCMSHREEVVLCRLHIGHTRLTCGFVTSRGDPPVCTVCDEALMVEHLLVSCCPHIRVRRWCCLFTSLSEVLWDDETCIKRLFEFLRRCNLIKSMQMYRFLLDVLHLLSYSDWVGFFPAHSVYYYCYISSLY